MVVGMLTDQQIETYRRDGYLVIPRLIEGEQLAELRRLTDRIVAEARGVSANDDLYDLEPSHSAALPRVRRLKPAIFKRYAFFHALARDPKITSILAQLLGPAIRQHGGKLNMKSAGYSSAGVWPRGRRRAPPRPPLPPPRRRPLLRRHEAGGLRHQLRQGRAADGPGRIDDHPSRPPGARLGAQPLQPPAAPAAARIHGRRRLAAAGRGQLRGVQRPHGFRRADHRAARRDRSHPHAAAAGRPSGFDLREPARDRTALLRDLRGSPALRP